MTEQLWDETLWQRLWTLEVELKEERRMRIMADEQRRKNLMDVLKLEFEARVAKGCYTNCPVGRLGKLNKKKSLWQKIWRK